MRPPSREEIRIRDVAKRTCAKPKDFNGMCDVFAELNIESKVIDGRTWVLCDDRILDLLENQQKRNAEAERIARNIIQNIQEKENKATTL